MRRIFYNGTVYIERDRFAEALLITDGIIEAVGTNEEILALATEDTERVDVEGRTILPGFNDSHLHLYGVGDRLTTLNLYGISSIAEIIRTGQDYIATHEIPAGSIVMGRGWNQDYFQDENRVLTRHDLDQISTEHPLVFTRACEHILTLNTKALELLGLNADSPEVEGGSMDRDGSGELLGVLRENAMYLANSLQKNPTLEERVKTITAAMAYANQFGITSVQTNDLKDEDYEAMLEAYQQVHDQGLATTRVYHQCCFTSHQGYENFLAQGHRTGDGNAMHKIGPLKLFVDGSLGARTALRREDYNDEPGTRGIACFSQEQLDQMVQTAAEHSMQVAVHAIGDRGIEMVLESYQKVTSHGENPLRHGIVHCQITDRPLLERFQTMDIFAYVQPIFLHYDLHIAENRVGQELASTSYAFHTMTELGLHMGLGSDAPVEDLQTMNNIHCAVNRQDLQLQPAEGWFSQERIDVTTAVDAYTIGSAYSSFEETVKGRLLPGYYGDLAILDENIFTVPTSQIKEISVAMTVLGGEIVYQR